jgi:hypothetical protein
MADVETQVEKINSLLAPLLKFKIAVVDPKDVVPQEKNARYMKGEMYNALVSNLKKDGALSSVPLCHLKDGKYICVSGHHRVRAAADAGIQKILIMYYDWDEPRSVEAARQLSHNSLSGEDDPALLAEIYAQITDISDKMYSGLMDKIDATIKSFSFQASPDFQELVFMFTKDEAEYIQTVLHKLGKLRVNMASLSSFDTFFDALLKAKEGLNIVNSDTALLEMARLIDVAYVSATAPVDGVSVSGVGGEIDSAPRSNEEIAGARPAPRSRRKVDNKVNNDDE